MKGPSPTSAWGHECPSLPFSAFAVSPFLPPILGSEGLDQSLDLLSIYAPSLWEVQAQRSNNAHSPHLPNFSQQQAIGPELGTPTSISIWTSNGHLKI